MNNINNEFSLLSVNLNHQAQRAGSDGPLAEITVTNVSAPSHKQCSLADTSTQGDNFKNAMRVKISAERIKAHYLDPQKIQWLVENDRETLLVLAGLTFTHKTFKSCCPGEYVACDEESSSMLKSFTIAIGIMEKDDDLNKILIVLKNNLENKIINFNGKKDIIPDVKVLIDNKNRSASGKLWPEIAFGDNLLSLKNFTMILEVIEKIYTDVCTQTDKKVMLTNDNKVLFFPLVIKKIIDYHDNRISRCDRYCHTTMKNIKQKLQTMIIIGGEVEKALEKCATTKYHLLGADE